MTIYQERCHQRSFTREYAQQLPRKADPIGGCHWTRTVGPILESLGPSAGVLLGMGKKIGLYAPESEKVIAESDLPASVAAMALDNQPRSSLRRAIG